jgi:hypothetical protein
MRLKKAEDTTGEYRDKLVRRRHPGASSFRGQVNGVKYYIIRDFESILNMLITVLTDILC